MLLARTRAYFRDIESHCQKDAEEHKKRVEMDQILDFLVGLNPDFEPIQAKILNDNVLPLLSGAYALVLEDEKHRAIMYTTPPKSSALIAV